MVALPTAVSAAARALASIALTTTFEPPPQCTQNQLTMVQNRAYEIWLNEPFPVPGITASSCYPSEVMSIIMLSRQGVSYPPFKPLVCPEMYSTVFRATSDYIACCPSGFTLAQSPSPLSDRPAYGGTCYTDIPMGKTLVVTAYDASSFLGPTTWVASTAGAQAYAYVIDGYSIQVTRTSSKTTNFFTITSTSTSVASYSNSPSISNSSPTPASTNAADKPTGLTSAGLIGTIAGSVFALISLIVTLVFGIRKWKSSEGNQPSTRFRARSSGSITYERGGRSEDEGARAT